MANNLSGFWAQVMRIITAIKKITKAPKIIWGSSIAIFIAVVGYWSLSSFWFWTSWEVVAALGVAVGCGGEYWLFKNPAETGQEFPHRRRELQFLLLVAIGVSMEFLALFHAISAAVSLERDVEISKSNNLVLQSNVNETKIELANAEARVNETEAQLTDAEVWLRYSEPYDLRDDDQSFAKSLKQMGGIQVKLRTAGNGAREQINLSKIQYIFLHANWSVVESSVIEDIGENGIVIGAGNSKLSQDAANLLSQNFSKRQVPTMVFFGINRTPTNEILVVICPPEYPMKSAFAGTSPEAERQKVRVADRIVAIKRSLAELDKKREGSLSNRLSDEDAFKYRNMQSELQDETRLVSELDYYGRDDVRARQDAQRRSVEMKIFDLWNPPTNKASK